MIKKLYHQFKYDIKSLSINGLLNLFFPITTLPILSLYYPVEFFGELEIIIGIASIISIIPNLRLENVILIEKEESKINNIYDICLAINLIIFSVTLLLLFTPFLGFLNHFLLGAIFGSASSITTLNYQIIVREKKFRWTNRITSITTVSKFLIALLFINQNYNGLIVSALLAQLISMFISFIVANKTSRIIKSLYSLNQIHIISEYSKFIKFTLPGDLLNNITQNIPIFLIRNYFGEFSLGLYAMARRLIAAPVGVISSVLHDIYRQQLTQEKNETNSGKQSFKSFLKIYLIISFITLIGIYTLSKPIINLILGEKWEQIFPILYFIGTYLIVRMVSGSLNYVFLVFDKQIIDLKFQILGILIPIGVIIFSNELLINFDGFILIFSILMSLFYILIIIKSFYVSKNNSNL